MSRIDPPPVDHSEIHQVPHDSGPKILLALHMLLADVLSSRDGLDNSVKTTIRSVSEKIVGFAHMSFGEAFELAEQPMHEVEEQFNQQFLNLREMRITGRLAWQTVKEAHNTVRQYLSFEIPGLAAAARLVAIHLVHCKALDGWSFRNRVYEYFDKNIDHLHRRAFILLDQSCGNATLESAGHMIYLGWLYGMTALLMNGVKVFAEEHPEEFFSGTVPNLNGMVKGRKAKAIDELIVHRAVPAFVNPALGIRYEGMTTSEDKILHRYNSESFIYPQLKGRVPFKYLRESSQQQLFDRVQGYNSELKEVDVMNSVIEGDNQPIDLGSLEVFTGQQMGRNFMHFLFRKIEEKEKDQPDNNGGSGNTAT